MRNNREKKGDSVCSFEQRYKMLLTVFDTLEPSFVIDHKGTILETNHAFADNFGKQVHECIGKNAYDLVPPEVAAIRRKKVDEALRTGKIITYEDERDGRFNRFMFFPIADKDGKMTQLYITAQDITELRIAEKEAVKLNVVSNALVEQIPGAVLIMDAHGRVVQWNAHERDVIVGKSESEMANTFVIETIHPDDRQLVGEKISSLFQSNHEDSAEVRILIHGGPEFRWYKISAKRIIINDTPYLIGIATDFTDHKLAEDAALKHSEDRFKTLFREHSAVKLLIDESTANIIDANQAAADFYGWSIEELRTMNMRDINTTPPEQALSAIEKSRLPGNHPAIFQHRMANGSLRNVEVYDTKINVEGKDLFYGIIHDVTDRMRAEVQLNKMSAAVEQSPTGVVITDSAGNIEYVNSKFTDITGYTAEEAKGEYLRMLQSGTLPDTVFKDLWQTIRSGKVWQGELYNKKKNGELFWENSIISAIKNRDGVITNFVAIKEDITLQKQINAELVAAKEKAEETDRLKSAFLATITHELRTPMNGILGFSELLKDPELPHEESVEFIDLIHQSGMRLLTLINELIDLARIEAGESLVQKVDTNVNKLLKEVTAFFKLEIHQKGLKLTCTPGLSDRESIIKTDSSKLTQILTNLVNNALKFTFQGGIEIGYTKNNGMLEFYIKDSGIGIPVPMQEKIFERFIQVDNPLTRQIEGSGLGLSIAKGYVTMLGGTIRVDSVEGKGTTFTFTLPYNPPGSNEPAMPAPSILVLIADDDGITRILFKKILKGENMTILYACNGQEAVDLAKHHPEINLVLMDIKMPLLNGYEATRQIKKLRPDLPIIAQSAFTAPEDQEKAIQAGCDGFIKKPINKGKLLELIHKLLNR